MDTTTLGSFIRNWRTGAERSQEAVAKEVGVSQATLSEWERDESRPGGDRFINLATAMGVEPKTLASMPGLPKKPRKEKADDEPETTFTKDVGAEGAVG